MDATLANNDFVLINKMAYKLKEPKYKDIVVLNSNVINDKLMNEKYIKESMVGNPDMQIKIPEGKIFVMGDNRNNSLDSRSLRVGLIDYKKDVIGKAVLRIFPFNKIIKF